ncbi:MAG: guanylate kinase [Proteobacteria bacterium]|nr:guanylate kinase [Pseudomonadota bacterium]MBU1686755.1 guanylate kinase [Pseudomonadota bacterium]
MKHGALFIISAPSGAGKTTILKKIMAALPALGFSVSHTTRQARTGEIDGTDYHFVTRSYFQEMLQAQAFLEWAEVHDNFYGTSRKSVTDQLNAGVDVLLDIDVQGARQVRESMEIPSISIFIAPPSLDALRNRLTGRATDSPETIRLRLHNAITEMADMHRYDHIIVNDVLDEAIEMVKAVILAERSRSGRLRSGAPLPVLIEANANDV